MNRNRQINVKILRSILTVSFLLLAYLGQSKTDVMNYVGEWKYLRSDLIEQEIETFGTRPNKQTMVVNPELDSPQFPFNNYLNNMLVMPDGLNILAPDFQFYDAKFTIQKTEGKTTIAIEDQRPADQRESNKLVYNLRLTDDGNLALGTEYFYRNPAGKAVKGTLEIIMQHVD